MNASGHIDIVQFDNWHRHIPYTIQSYPHSGFNFVDPQDANRYKTEYINVYLSREIPVHLQDFFSSQFTWLENIAYSDQKLEPGMILPWHTDTYAFFRKNKRIADINNIMRIIVFLEDWQSGHISEVGTTVNTKYKAGDWISWVGETPHIAANVGHTNRYTLQITGVAK
jgi:hypothetical protein